MNPLSFTPMYTQTPMNSSIGREIPDLPEEFLTEGEYMSYNVLDEEDKEPDGQEPERAFSRGDLIRKDLAHLPFQSAESEHFEFFYLPDSDGARDLASIMEKRERAWTAVCDFLFINPPDIHTLYLFGSDRQAFCPTWGKTFASRALPEEHMAGIVYLQDLNSYENVNFGHELTHLLEYYFLPYGKRVPPYFREGLADYLSQSPLNPHLRFIGFLKTFLVGEPFILSREKLNRAEYMESASLTAYLVETFGKDRFLEFYHSLGVLNKGEEMEPAALDAIFGKVFGYTSAQLMHNFYGYICTLWNHPAPPPAMGQQEAIHTLLSHMDQLAAQENQEAICAFYSQDFYYLTEQQMYDIYVKHMTSLIDKKFTGCELTELGTWLYGKTCAVKALYSDGNQEYTKIFVLEYLLNTWRFSPKYPGGITLS